MKSVEVQRLVKLHELKEIMITDVLSIRGKLISGIDYTGRLRYNKETFILEYERHSGAINTVNNISEINRISYIEKEDNNTGHHRPNCGCSSNENCTCGDNTSKDEIFDKDDALYGIEKYLETGEFPKKESV